MGVQSAPSRHETDEQSDQARDFPLRLMQELTHCGLETEQSGLISSRLTEMLLELVVQRSSDIEDLPTITISSIASSRACCATHN